MLPQTLLKLRLGMSFAFKRSVRGAPIRIPFARSAPIFCFRESESGDAAQSWCTLLCWATSSTTTRASLFHELVLTLARDVSMLSLLICRMGMK